MQNITPLLRVFPNSDSRWLREIPITVKGLQILQYSGGAQRVFTADVRGEPCDFLWSRGGLLLKPPPTEKGGPQNVRILQDLVNTKPSVFKTPTTVVGVCVFVRAPDYVHASSIWLTAQMHTPRRNTSTRPVQDNLK